MKFKACEGDEFLTSSALQQQNLQPHETHQRISNRNKSRDIDKMRSSAIAGIIVGIVLAVLIILRLCCWTAFAHEKERNRREEKSRREGRNRREAAGAARRTRAARAAQPALAPASPSLPAPLAPEPAPASNAVPPPPAPTLPPRQSRAPAPFRGRRVLFRGRRNNRTGAAAGDIV